MIVRSQGNSDGVPARPRRSNDVATDAQANVAPSPRAQPVLIVTGMHRSATSVMASLCQSAGLYIGERMMRPAESNPVGHFEDLDFYDFHQRALAANGLCPNGFLANPVSLEVPATLHAVAKELITARRTLSQPWGWKDPRTVLFLEFWQAILPDARWLFVVREPSQVVDSLFRRGDVAFLDNPPFALKVWRHYNETIRAFIRCHPERSLVIDANQIGQDPQAVIDTIRTRLGVPLSSPTAVYRPELLATQASPRHMAFAKAAEPLAYELYADLRELAGLGDMTADRGSTVRPLELTDAAIMAWAGATARDKAAAKTCRLLEEQIASLTSSIDHTTEELAAGKHRIASLESHLAALKDELADRSRAAEAFQAVVAERDSSLARQSKELADRDATIATLASDLQAVQNALTIALHDHDAATSTHEQQRRELNTVIASFQSFAAERDALLATRTADVADRDATIAALARDLEAVQNALAVALHDHDAAATNHEQQRRELDEQITTLQTAVVERDSLLASRTADVADRDATIAALARDFAAGRDAAARLREAAREQDARLDRANRDLEQALMRIKSLEHDTAHRARLLARMETDYREQVTLYERVLQSNSWWLTKPLRETRRWATHPRRQFAYATTGLLAGCRRLYDTMPFSLQTRMRHRRFLASRFPRLLLASGSPAATIPGLLRTAPPPAISPVLSPGRPQPQAYNGLHRPLEAVAPEPQWPPITIPPSNAPVVSIIVPVHNQWPHTHACLQSIVEGEPDLAYEVILADDVSTDDTRHAGRWVQGLVICRNVENLGFLRNCNAAASRARGEYILFLNNDTQIQPGAISALVQTFRDHADAGLVGSKLIYPDGRLQEAGGIVWADGSAWNYGRGQNPTLPEFNYLRETDYCSGASIMVPRSLFAELGGFDQRYSPAYNEDSDLAFAIRAKGRKVYYQPASVVVHHEGVSHGTDVSQGVKARQVENQQRFRDKWHDTLVRDHMPNGQNVFRARDRSANRKTILVVDHYVPQPDRDAGSRTMWCFLGLFRAMGMNVKFWPQNLYYDKEYTPPLEQQGIEVFHGPQYLDRFEAWARDNGPQLDYVLLSRPHIAIEFLAALRRHSRAKILYYGHDLHHARMLNQFQVKGDPVLHKQALAMLELEQSLWRQVDAVYYPSAEETSVVANACPGVTARTVPPYSFEEHGKPTPGPRGRTGILFVAGFGHPPNVDAAEWLVREIMPLVRREVPDAHLSLVGSNPTAAVQQLASEAVTVTGYVSDERLDEFYRTARVAVVPLRFGAGVKSKVIEALHHGLPLVTTPTGAQGIAGLDLILPVSADPARIAQEIVTLLRDDGHWRDVASAGQRYVSNRFSQSAMRAAFAQDLAFPPLTPVASPLPGSRPIAT